MSLKYEPLPASGASEQAIFKSIQKWWLLSRSSERGIDRLRVGEVSRGENMALRGTDPESYITDYTLVYEDLKHSKVDSYMRGYPPGQVGGGHIERFERLFAENSSNQSQDLVLRCWP